MTLQILDKVESYEDDSGELKFHHSSIILRNTNSRNIFLVHVPDRILSYDEISILKTLENLIAAVLINPDGVFPRFDPSAGFTTCPNPASSDVFVKRPSLLTYDPDSDEILEIFLQEAQLCETLLKNFPHVNLAQYLGCQVEDSRITGLCFKRYQKTLSEKVKQNRLDSDSIGWDYHACIEGIRNGIEHLHKHGYCHNDINPTNIMLDANDSSIIIDFDSCRPEGDKLLKVGTFNWNETIPEQSQRSNDLEALIQIQNFLETSSAKQ